MKEGAGKSWLSQERSVTHDPKKLKESGNTFLSKGHIPVARRYSSWAHCSGETNTKQR